MQQRAASREKGAEIAAKVDVGKVAEKVVKNVRVLLRTSFWETGAEVADRERESRQPRTRSPLRSLLGALLTSSYGTTSTPSATRR